LLWRNHEYRDVEYRDAAARASPNTICDSTDHFTRIVERLARRFMDLYS
jgi:hypothetical protein